MDYHLLACMLSNYRRLFIESERSKGTPVSRIIEVLERDIDSYIEYFNRENLREEAERSANQRRDELEDAREALANSKRDFNEAKVALKRKLEAALAK
jgi:hypothetical protein